MDNSNSVEQDGEPQGASVEFIQSLKESTIDQDNITCSICLEGFKENEKCIQLPCKDNPHYFHAGNENCPGIIEWLNKSNTCPLCRTEFPKKRRLIRINVFHLLNSFSINQMIRLNEEAILNQVLENSLNDQ